VLRRTLGDQTEFITLTFWDSLDAVRAFAGDDYERAVYYPADTAFLPELLPTIEHYELPPPHAGASRRAPTMLRSRDMSLQVEM